MSSIVAEAEARTQGYKEQIARSSAIAATDLQLPAPATKIVGKVRDIYVLPERKQVVLVSTDRQSAFDRQLASVPCKGQVLTLTSAWWFKATEHIVPNHVIATPHPCVVVCKQATVFSVEFVVRGYITGSTSTSMWTNYAKGCRDFCGHKLADGYVQHQKLPENLVTPTTKDDVHDELISGNEVVSSGRMTQAQWDYCHQKALELFAFGQATAAKRGLILVDTKYEFGVQEDGTILLIDEIHTPDSSRYWLAASYEARMAAKQSPDNIDKEFLRLWFKDNCDPYNDAVLPAAPTELVQELARRYILLFELITGNTFSFESPDLQTAMTAFYHQ
ncbi:phosphoribosylaminoimidazole-succinocarboxamide synthase [Saprolegnia parasitica CBS 223.65]|uniref:phosphoribosylaminoimidazolesuccinocarboxamide synthase n=1 Tax=Saprolegnia parasitica (strain CBS 223.65) TaxID=695850 RepID=A0A067CPM5_SAPPC|nr:phosphoribosylaminoimidazole-succinocarboxamide synthase [Saprolegnia parasitica CBS 223.65]KDO28742.1 phosphoribosylaminoimidazole-succinocarboxamide synthase [Saprolegnia parasitica CBS 223.65]|eukprot:XP_012200375.1 phosphoribosylaminoimidazole-succinocarboxamide synthase [Saprolegnia parasitica CBS 223.65]